MAGDDNVRQLYHTELVDETDSDETASGGEDMEDNSGNNDSNEDQ